MGKERGGEKAISLPVSVLLVKKVKPREEGDEEKSNQLVVQQVDMLEAKWKQVKIKYIFVQSGKVSSATKQLK